MRETWNNFIEVRTYLLTYLLQEMQSQTDLDLSEEGEIATNKDIYLSGH